MRPLPVLVAAAVLVCIAAACTGGDDSEPTSTAEVPQTGTATVVPGGTARPAVTAASSFEYESEAIGFTYGPAWRVSGRTASSITLTATDAPGDVLLTVQWQPLPGSGDFEGQYLSQLAAVGSAIEQLRDLRVDGVVAHRYASARGTDDRSAVSLSVLFSSDDWAYLATLSTDADSLAPFVAPFDEVLETVALR
jgi:hypothetical protein